LKRWRQNSGFTLVELLVSLSLFCVIVTASFSVLAGASRYCRKFEDKMSSREALVAVAVVLMQDIWAAATLTVENDGQKLVLTQIVDGIIQSVAYDLNGGQVRRKTNATSAYLTYDEKIMGLRFADLGRGLVSFEVTISSSESYAYLAQSRVVR
jgi:prepilin-type N-terminal cleavage/methylation domain-containing protein